VSRKTSEIGGLKSSCLSPDVFRRASLDDLSQLSDSFSSEANTVLIFFAYFFLSRKKSEWGLGQSHNNLCQTKFVIYDGHYYRPFFDFSTIGG
jgi:hypothetical protein